MNKTFELIRLFGQPVLYSRNRVSDRNLPQTVHRYELAKVSGDDRLEVYLESHAQIAGYVGTIISKFSLPADHLRTDRDLELDTTEMATVQDYLADSYLPEPEPEDEITVLIVEPWQLPYEARISNSYQVMQEIVGGPIEVVSPFDDNTVLVCNEIGKLLGLPLNRQVGPDIIAGTFILCGTRQSDFVSLSSNQIQHYQNLFRSIEVFVPRDRQSRLVRP